MVNLMGWPNTSEKVPKAVLDPAVVSRIVPWSRTYLSPPRTQHDRPAALCWFLVGRSVSP